MVVFPKQICKRFLPDAGESRSDKTFFLKTNMELEACTSLGSMFHRRGALFVNEIRPANDAGWNGRKSPCCRPRVLCWCSWKLSFSRSNAGADCWWQRRIVVNSCRDQRCDKSVSFKFLISGRTSSWGWTPARHRTAFFQSARSLSCWPVGMNGMVAEAAYSKSGWITETKNCLLAVGVNCLYVRRKAPILRPTFLQIESTWGDQERLSSMIIPRRRVCETSLTSSFCSKSRTPVGRPWHARECGRWPWQPFWKHWSIGLEAQGHEKYLSVLRKLNCKQEQLTYVNSTGSCHQQTMASWLHAPLQVMASLPHKC